jgi:hypothetical protein
MPGEFVRPPLEVVNGVINDAVRPLLSRIEKGLGQPLPLVVTVWSPNMLGPRMLVTSAEPATEAEAKGEVRLSFRETFVKGRLLFRAEAVCEKSLSPETGLSGFEVRGEVKPEGDRLVVNTGSSTIRYHVWQWRDWK